MRTDLYQGCQWNHSVVKQANNISETKKIAMGFISLQNIHGTPHSGHGPPALERSEFGFTITTGIRSDALGCFSAKRVPQSVFEQSRFLTCIGLKL